MGTWITGMAMRRGILAIAFAASCTICMANCSDRVYVYINIIGDEWVY